MLILRLIVVGLMMALLAPDTGVIHCRRNIIPLSGIPVSFLAWRRDLLSSDDRGRYRVNQRVLRAGFWVQEAMFGNGITTASLRDYLIETFLRVDNIFVNARFDWIVRSCGVASRGVDVGRLTFCHHDIDPARHKLVRLAGRVLWFRYLGSVGHAEAIGWLFHAKPRWRCLCRGSYTGIQERRP